MLTAIAAGVVRLSLEEANASGLLKPVMAFLCSHAEAALQ